MKDTSRAGALDDGESQVYDPSRAAIPRQTMHQERPGALADLGRAHLNRRERAVGGIDGATTVYLLLLELAHLLE